MKTDARAAAGHFCWRVLSFNSWHVRIMTTDDQRAYSKLAFKMVGKFSRFLKLLWNLPLITPIKPSHNFLRFSPGENFLARLNGEAMVHRRC